MESGLTFWANTDSEGTHVDWVRVGGRKTMDLSPQVHELSSCQAERKRGEGTESYFSDVLLGTSGEGRQQQAVASREYKEGLWSRAGEK